MAKPAAARQPATQDTYLGRAAQPAEVAPSYVFLASRADSEFLNGQVLNPSGVIAVGSA